MTAESFFEEMQRLIRSLPKPPVRIENCEDCELGDSIFNCKNVNRSFDCYESTNLLYAYDSYLCDNCIDCDYAVEAQLCYECVDPYKAFNCEFLSYCDNIHDSAFCYNCSNSHDLFGCVNMKNMSFCIFNRQLTEAEYREKLEKYKKLPYQKVLRMVEDLKKRYPLTQAVVGSNVNSEYGNYVHFSKNCYLCFDAAHNEDCGYLFDSFHCKRSYDLTYCGHDSNLCYENYYTGVSFNCDYAIFCEQCRDSSYIVNCTNAKNCLGCVGLDNHQYCILNRQLLPEEYNKVSAQILEDIRKKNLSWSNLVY